MSSLVAPRPPGWRMREDDDRQGSLFGGEAFLPTARPRPQRPAPEDTVAPPREVSAPPEEIPAPPRDVAPPEGIAAPVDDTVAPPEGIAAPVDDTGVRREGFAAPPRDVAPPENAAPSRDAVAPPPEGFAAPPREVAAPHDVVAPPAREFVVPDEEAEEFRVTRAVGSPLAGPTLDDAVSRAWEGLVAGVPTACPVCHGEIEPGRGGRVQGYCGTCHVTLD